MSQPRYVSRSALPTTPTGEPFLLRKQFVCDSIDKVAAAKSGTTDTTRQRRFVISTSSVDRDNDTISIAGWELENYLANPVVLFAHDYSSLPVAKALSLSIQGDKLIATAEFANHPMANTCLELIDGGFLRATSVGFRPKEMKKSENRDNGYDFLKQELLEFSIVPVPANPEALIMAEAEGIDTTEIRAWAAGVMKALKKDVALPAVDANGEVQEARPTCPACGGAELTDENTCPACGWVSPDADPMHAPVVVGAKPSESKTAEKKDVGAGEEAAELVRYKTLLTMLDGIASLLGASRDLVATMIANEAVEAGDEAAEEEHEDASLSSLRALCSQMLGSLYGVSQLAYDTQEAADDSAADVSQPAFLALFAPKPAKRLKEIGDGVEKRGRVISAANEGRIRKAVEHSKTCSEHLNDVLAKLEEMPKIDDDEDTASTTPAAQKTSVQVVLPSATAIDAEVLVIDDIADDVLSGIKFGDVKDALTSSIREAIKSAVQTQTRSALDRMRGRVD